MAVALARYSRSMAIALDGPHIGISGCFSISLLDPESKGLHVQGMTVIMITHNPERAEGAGRVIPGRDGIEGSGPVADAPSIRAPSLPDRAPERPFERRRAPSTARWPAPPREGRSIAGPDREARMSLRAFDPL